jgi:hypothetical protein
MTRGFMTRVYGMTAYMTVINKLWCSAIVLRLWLTFSAAPVLKELRFFSFFLKFEKLLNLIFKNFKEKLQGTFK